MYFIQKYITEDNVHLEIFPRDEQKPQYVQRDIFSIKNGIIRKRVESNKFKLINNKYNLEQGIDDFMKN